MCRSVLIETIELSDRCLSLISKSLSETLRLAVNRLTEKQTITHLMVYLVDMQTTQLTDLLSIKSDEFCGECLTKLSDLKKPLKQLPQNEDINKNIANIVKQIKETVNNSTEVKKTEFTYVSGRPLDEVIDDFTYAFGGQQIDKSFVSQVCLHFDPIFDLNDFNCLNLSDKYLMYKIE